MQDHRDEILERHGSGGRDQHQRADLPDGGPSGAPRRPVATEARGEQPVDCRAMDTAVFEDDLEAFLSGFATVSTFDSELRPVG